MIRTLIIEDDFRVAEINAAYVATDSDFEVVGVAHTAASGYQMVVDKNPDLVLLDLYLPDEHGLELFARLQQLPRGSKPDVIVITAAKDSQSLRDSIQLGATTYIVKPFLGHELTERLLTYKSGRDRMKSSDNLSQADADATLALLRGEKVQEIAEITSSNPTSLLIIKSLESRSEALSAVEIAMETGMSRATAQRYLSQMADRKIVVLELQYGTAGRPINKYRLVTTHP
jgi:response regulator of citrate/malate metabolism